MTSGNEAGSEGGRRTALTAGGLLLLLHLPWIFQGVDVTDEGFNLTQQWAITGTEPVAGDLTWFSHLLGGLWLRLVDGVLGARVGWALVNSLTGAVAAAALSRQVSPRRASLAVVAVGGANLYYWPMTADYNTIPALLLLVGTVPWLGRTPKPAGVAFSGVFLGMAALARLPAAPGLLLPLWVVGLRALLTWRRPARGDALAAGAAAGWGLATCVLGLGLASGLGFLQSATSPYTWLSGSGEGRYSLGKLWSALWNSGQTAVGWGIEYVVLVGVGAALLVGLGLGARARRVLVPCWAVFVLCFKTRLTWFNFGHLLVGAALGLGLVLGAVLVSRRGQLPPRWIVAGETLGAGLGLTGLAFLGSSNGVMAGHYGLWLLAPAAFLYLERGLVDCDLRLGRARFGRLDSALLAASLLTSLGVVGLVIRYRSAYRDAAERMDLSAGVASARLEGVRTTPERAQTLNRLLRALGPRVEPGDPLLVYGGAPLLIYLTGARPYLDHSWPEMLTEGQLELLLSRAGPSPRVVVRVQTDTTKRTWGASRGPIRRKVGVGVARLDRWVKTQRYAQVWEGGGFVIFERGEAD